MMTPTANPVLWRVAGGAGSGVEVGVTVGVNFSVAVETGTPIVTVAVGSSAVGVTGLSWRTRSFWPTKISLSTSLLSLFSSSIVVL